MTIGQRLLPEFDHEMENTRRVLERVPADKLDWRPHPKSGTFAWLAGHVANLSNWATMTLKHDSFDVQPKGEEMRRYAPPSTRDEILAEFEKCSQEGREAIASATDEQMMQNWSLLKGGETIFSMPRIAVLRGVVMNHLIHHRGELCLYLRLNDIPVPALYGPSADEGGF